MKTSATPSATARARLGLIVSMTVFGTIGLFVRRIEITSAELALCRAGLAAVFLLLSFLVTRRRLCLSEIKKSLWLLLASGAAMGINWMLLFEAYQYTTISLATLSYYLAPVIVTALCPLLFHEKMTRTQVLCFLMSTLGVALIIGSGSVHGGASDVRGICFGVSAAVFYAAVILLNKYITGVPALERTFVQFLAAILVLAPYVGLTSGFHPEVLSATGWVNLLIVGFVHTGLTYCMYFSAIRTLPGQESSLLSYLDPIVSVLISVLLLGEPLAPIQIAGMVLFLGFAIANEFTHKNAETTCAPKTENRRPADRRSFYHLSQNHQQRPRADEQTADQGLGREVLMQKHERQHERDDHAELIDRHDLRRLPDLQRAVIAQPRRPRRQTREDQKQPALPADVRKSALRVGHEHHTPRHRQHDHRADGSREVGVHALDAHLGQNGRQRREHGREQSKYEPHTVSSVSRAGHARSTSARRRSRSSASGCERARSKFSISASRFSGGAGRARIAS